MATDSNAALLNVDRLTATGIPKLPLEDPNLLGIAPRASSFASAITPGLSTLAATPADIDIEAIGANWIAQGPASVNVGNNVGNFIDFPTGVRNDNPAGALDNQVAGAIQTVLADPNDANNLWVGTVNGGIWRTNNALTTKDGAGKDVPTERPTWTSLTDQFRGLSIGAMALDPTDGRAIVAGIGHYSSYNREGGSLIGLLLSTDGGDTFTEIGLRDLNISGVAKRGDIILASTNAGVYRGIRDINTGVWTFTTVTDVTNGSNPVRLTGNAFDLVGDPTDNQRFYTAVAGSGIFLSTDSGLNWTNISAVNADLNNRISANNVNTKIAVSPVNGRVYVGVIQSNVAGPDADVPSGNRPVYIGFREKQGTNWTQMDLPITPDQRGLNPEEGEEEEETGGQGVIHFSIVADRTDANTVYVGGDRQRLFRGSTIPNPVNPGGQASIDTTGDGIPDLSPQWQLLFGTGATANNSAPHADSRHMTFDHNGNLIEVDDGGIYKRTNPQNNTGDWFSLNGNLQITEQHDIAYDTVSNILVSGNQDNGTTRQTATQRIWDLAQGADGGDVAVAIDPTNPAQSVLYSSGENLGAFTRRFYGNANNLISTTPIVFDTNGDGKADPLTDLPFVTPIAINKADAHRLVFGAGSNIYEFTDPETLPPPGSQALTVNTTVTSIPGGGQVSSGHGEQITYGGRRSGQGQANVLYVGSDEFTPHPSGPPTINHDDLYVRKDTGATLVRTAYRNISNAGSVRGIALDNEDWQTAFVIDNDNVFQTTDAGANWADITGDLFDSDRFRNLDINKFANPLGAGDYLASIKFIPGPTLNALVVGTTQGVFASLSNHWGDWFALGPATQPNTAPNRLPHVPVWDIDFANTAPNAPNGLLAVGTLGRGAWTINNINTVLNSAPRPNGGISYDVNEGSSITLDASRSSDPNGLPLTYTWDLNGNGIFGEAGEVGMNPTFSAAGLDGPRDSTTVKLRVTNSGGSSAIDKNIRINIKNVAPIINGLALSSTVINENDTITLNGSFNDPGLPDGYKITINWGDGTTSVLTKEKLPKEKLSKEERPLTRTFQLSHQYLDDPPSGTPSDLLPITVTVDDLDGGIAQASTAIRVNNLNPVITSFTSNANFADRARINRPVNINATFTDIGTLDTHRAFVDWGDGTPTQEVTLFQGSGSGAVQGSHVYAKGGAYTMKLTLNDDDTGTDARFTTAIVIGTGGGPG